MSAARCSGKIQDCHREICYREGRCIEAAAFAPAVLPQPKPIPMVLHCPACGLQHIDAPDPAKGWDNRPHRSHECQGCAYTWRVADVPTTGVASVTTKGKQDSAPLPVGATFMDRFKASCRAELAQADAAAAGIEKLRTWPGVPVEACHTCGFLAGAHLDGCPVLSINGGA